MCGVARAKYICNGQKTGPSMPKTCGQFLCGEFSLLRGHTVNPLAVMGAFDCIVWWPSWSLCRCEAIDILRQEFEKPAGETGVLVSLDFQKCFDTVDPKLGLLCLEHIWVVQVQYFLWLQVVWKQRRWLTYSQEYLPPAVQVLRSLPQGDAVSPLTLLALMTGLTATVAATLVTYLDDRNFIARSAAQTAELWKLRKESSAQLGLWESDSKLKVVCRKAAFRHKALGLFCARAWR